MKKILPLFAGIALLTGVSTTNASEPIQLTTAQMDNVVAGDCTSNYCSSISNSGNQAFAIARAIAIGDNTFAFASTTTTAYEYGSHASSSATSITTP